MDSSLTPEQRVESLVAAMTLAEKLAQLGGVWDREGGTGGNVAPMEDVFGYSQPFEVGARHGIGHLTRVFGTRPVTPEEGMERLAELQQNLKDSTRLGVPALAHEECLTGFTTLGATVFPTPLAWAATYDPGLVEEMAAAIGTSLRSVGVHQGLAPVLDVVRDHRWGRVEETMGEDPYLVGTLGSAYVRGLQSAGVIATLKHFAGYSASRSGRNHGPVSMGLSELADVVLPPFEMAVRAAGAGSVMNSYSDVDGVPSAADPWLLTDVLRNDWGFTGTVVSDYWSVSFLETMHRVAATPGEAAAAALAAGIDVELPDTRCFGDELAGLIADGRVDEDLVDRAVRRVLHQKLQLGLLDADWSPRPPTTRVDLDPPDHRALARRIAEASVVLLANPEGALPIRPDLRRIALLGPCADDPRAFLGCYSYPNHVLPDHPDLGLGVPVPSVLEALRSDLPEAVISHVGGCSISTDDRSAIPRAVAAAAVADLAIVVVGDQAGLFGRGTSGEGCDVEDLRLPGVQAELVTAVLDTGTPTVLLVVSGRPYALGDFADRAVAVVQAFFPGEEGGPALAGVLTGRTVPSGKLPVQVPARAGGQPHTYLHALLGEPDLGVSSLDGRPLYPFGHGLSYTTFAYSDLRLSRTQVDPDSETEISCLVRNTGNCAGTEVAQLYVSHPVARVARPVLQLAGYARVTLDPGEGSRVAFQLPARRTAYTDRHYRRLVDPGVVTVLVGPSSADLPLRGELCIR
ncbi:beta-glucosidase family protein [Nocardioides astragali]|uniref:Beta-glucosidase n=1 Tax=Nocardioides astragali TaxID=1776736 RepID=A0ABW2NBW1_9ACTN|nr:glycoside hydrolase family 3 N-terminal domain-containing protein [Nocardioides astragali]